MSLCGRLGPVFLSSAVQTGRYPGTRMSVDPVYKVARSGARVEEMRWRDRTVIDGILGIDVCKNTLDVSISSYTKVRTKSFTNSPDGWRHLLDWLIAQKIQRVHACLESTGRYSLGIACALYEADHVVSIINPAQIRDFVRTKLGRNKTDGVDASHRTKSFTNSPDGWRHLLDWLIAQKIQRVHACLESTGRYSLGIACALYEADHVVSIINPAQIRDFVRTKLGRNKTDGVDASRTREY